MGKWDDLSIWKEPDKEEQEYRGRDALKGHPDPTADLALANILREERRKKADPKTRKPQKGQPYAKQSWAGRQIGKHPQVKHPQVKHPQTKRVQTRQVKRPRNRG